MKRNHKRNAFCIVACCAVLAVTLTIQPVVAKETKRDILYYKANSGLALSAGREDKLDLSVSTKFQITRPTEALTTTYSTYYITGTSDPAVKLTCNGEEITRGGTLGTFGYQANLQMGQNTFTFRQGDKSQTVTITRKGAAAAGKISEITKSSMYPSLHGGVKAGGTLTVSCTAPSGASVSAAFGGQTVTLKQAATADKGIPAVFRGEIPVSTNYSADVTTNAGPVTYTMSYNGATKSYTSSGDVYVAGTNCNLAVRVTNFIGFVYPDTAQQAVFKEMLKRDATDYVVSCDNKYVQLYSGGFVPIDQVEFIEGSVRIKNNVSQITASNYTKYEIYSFEGTSAPAYDVKQTDASLILTLYNTTSEGKPPVADSKLFSAVSRNADGNTVTYTYTLKEGAAVWGYSVTFDKGVTNFTVRYKPKLSSNPDKPFEGLVVLLDPGHGGSDPGALGVAGGLNGPNESILNLAQAYAVRERLTQLGATVYLTRDGVDVERSLDDRLEAIESCGADMFIALHHNSVAVTSDGSKGNGVETYYHTAYSRSLSQNLLNNITNTTGRLSRKSLQSYFRVTLLPQCPSVLAELGFVSNPAEYEKLTQSAQIDSTARGISNGILVTIR